MEGEERGEGLRINERERDEGWEILRGAIQIAKLEVSGMGSGKVEREIEYEEIWIKYSKHNRLESIIGLHARIFLHLYLNSRSYSFLHDGSYRPSQIQINLKMFILMSWRSTVAERLGKVVVLQRIRVLFEVGFRRLMY